MGNAVADWYARRPLPETVPFNVRVELLVNIVLVETVNVVEVGMMNVPKTVRLEVASVMVPVEEAVRLFKVALFPTIVAVELVINIVVLVNTGVPVP